MKKIIIKNIEKIFQPDLDSRSNYPIFLESVSAGFPSPADDYLEGKLDLNEHLVRNPASTFFVRVTGDSMINAGIYSGDILIVDRSLNTKSGNIVIAVLDGDLTVKRFIYENGIVKLYPENPAYKPIEVKGEMKFEVWGVVRTVIHNVL